MIRRAAAADAPSLTATAHAAKRPWGYPEDCLGARRVGEVPSTPAGRMLPRLEVLTGWRRSP